MVSIHELYAFHIKLNWNSKQFIILVRLWDNNFLFLYIFSKQFDSRIKFSDFFPRLKFYRVSCIGNDIIFLFQKITTFSEEMTE